MEPLTADDPRQVSVYRLQSRLGAGGMGRVYLASSPGGRAVAVKVVHPELAHDPEFMRRFRREVEAAESVGGAYTAPVVGAGPDDDPPWLATAFVPGPSLSELVATAGPLTEGAVWRLAGGLVEALQAIHARGIVHRDLKPGNILIAADGPRVIDFGVSRALHGRSLTATNTTMGTPAYMSPEQAESSDIGPASDVFSLGSVLAFAATGTAPFDGGDMLSVIYRIVHAEPDLGSLPPALAGLVAGCLAKDPAGRLDLGALLATVTARAAAFPASAPGQFWPEPVAAVIARQAGAASQAGTAGQASGGRAAGYVPTYSHPATPRAAHAGGTAPPTPPPTGAPGPGTLPGRRGSGRWLLAIGAAAVVAAGIGTAVALLGSPGSTNANQTPPSRPAAVATTRAAATHAATSAPATSAPTTSATATTAPSTSAPATSPPASPSTALIAVTVCQSPESGCNFPGGAQYMEIRPNQIVDSGDGSASMNDLVWSDWGAPEAHATGVQEVDNCNPSCANGKYTGYAATVTVGGLTPYGTGLEGYSTIVIQSAGGLSETYTKKTTIPG